MGIVEPYQEPTEYKEPKTKLQKSINRVIKALKKDPDYYFALQSNIAMSFVDSQRWYFERNSNLNQHHKLSKEDLHEIANDAAKHFLNLLIGEK